MDRKVGESGREAGITVVERIVEAIREGIAEGRLVPGQRLVEIDLTEEFGVSRGPLREALRRLSADGLVDIQPYRGASVRRPSRQDLDDLFNVRASLEGLAARLAAERIDEPDRRAAGSQMLASMHERPPAGDVVSHIDQNSRFHAFILELAQSPRISQIVGQLQLPSYRHEFFRLFSAKISRDSHRQHVDILDAILRGDAELAERRMREHIGGAAKLARTLPATLFRN